MKKSPKKQDAKTAATSNVATKSTKAKAATAGEQKPGRPRKTETSKQDEVATKASAPQPKTTGLRRAAKEEIVEKQRPEQPAPAKTAAEKAPPVKSVKAPPPGKAVVPPKNPKRRLAPPVPGKALKVPPILLEGDLPPAPTVSGPGLRYALAPQPVAGAPARREIGELPESYGTGRIFLAARDPHWLYASWDFTAEQQKELNARSRDGHLILRVFAEGEQSPTVPEVHIHPESRNWFINVPRAETRYWAEIGFYERDSNWRTVSVSQSTFAPPDAPSEDLSAEFATIPPQVTFKQVIEAVEEFVARKEGQPLLEAVAEAQRQEQRLETETDRQREGTSSAEPGSQAPTRAPHAGERRDAHAVRGRAKAGATLPVRIEPGSRWTREQRVALRRLIHIDERRRVFLGSIEITELVRRQLEEEISSITIQEEGRIPGVLRAEELPGIGISSPLGFEIPSVRGRKFWFKVNAELIVYGATEPDAKVTVAERQIKLRPDGTFSFRFSLPDGRYQLPAVAISGDGEEAREARLEFARSTEYEGRVEAHPQDASLSPPRPENIQ